MAGRVQRVESGRRQHDAGLQAEWTAVQQRWTANAELSEQSIARLVELGDRFVGRLMAAGIHRWCDVDAGACWSFVTAPTRSGAAPRPATQHTRRAAVRAIFRELRALGVVTGDPTLDDRLPRRAPRDYRPLTDDEIVLGRAASRLGGGSRTLLRAVAWALAEAGAATSEIPALRVGDLDDVFCPTSLSIPASRRFAGRTVPLTSWAGTLLARHLARPAEVDPGLRLAVTPRGGADAYRSQASVCTGLTRVLDLAGLRDDPAVRARSIRGWAGRSRYDAGMPLEDVACFLGHRSLDGAAADIGLSWPAAVREDGAR